MTNRKPNENQIARHCEEHLDNEITLLRQFIETSESINQRIGLTPADKPSTDELFRSIANNAEQLALARSALQTEMAAFLGVPGRKVTVRELASALPATLAEPITTRRNQLLELESAIRSMNRTNSFLVQQSFDLYQRIVAGLAGENPSAKVYSPKGIVGDMPTGNLLKTDC